MPPAAHVPAAPKAIVKDYPLKFTGSGPQYFRVWFVNVILTLLTLGIYTPWARKRTAEYFFGHSVIARSPLEFAASIRRMVIGFFIFVGLYLLFRRAIDSQSTFMVFAALLGVALAVPFLWGSAKRFRITSTRWRGLRLRFGTSWREIYWASWPVFVIAASWFLVYVGIDMIQAFTAPSLLEDPQEQPAIRMGAVGWTLVALAAVVSWLCLVRVDYNYRRLLVQRTYLGEEGGVWKARYADFVRIWLVTALIFAGVLCSLGVGLYHLTRATQVHEVLMEWLVADETALQSPGRQPPGADGEAALEGASAGQGGDAWDEGDDTLHQRVEGWWRQLVFLVLVVVLIAFFMLYFAAAVALAYREARVHRLVWSSVGISDLARFRSTLGVWGFVWLRLQNWLLTMLTLGLYRPFARVREYRAKWDSTSVHIRGGVTQVKSLLVIQQQGGAFADAIADFAGFDIVG
ncbi:DUF898 family protein [Corticibacter populi]|uniref:DUF898 family protein n=1 Tax=Corticibacter populi TaxID=1550736 RepID=A0A3M6QJ02_9BURK|nr:DUF898 family protein [Corticibacter populi]RMX03056.1 DUF898 family protein [Corticibacter populi]RZS33495.1 uncharacterized membrane protein YjgN (DUF898 family) [Corticibacter populi]